MVPITISGKDFKLTPAIKAQVIAKLSRLNRLNTQVQRIGVELDIDRGQNKGKIFRIEVWAYLPKRTIKAGIKAEDMLVALDLVIPKIKRQLVDDKKKRITLRKEPPNPVMDVRPSG